MTHHDVQGDAHERAHAHGHQHYHLDEQPDASEPAHVGIKTYLVVALILGIVTAMEVISVESSIIPVNLVLPFLLVLTVVKFFLVVLFYMHLKMDHAIFGRVFYGPLFLAVLVVVGMILLFHVLPTYGKFSS
jgi:cytochrome c oxidase subunit IV